MTPESATDIIIAVATVGAVLLAVWQIRQNGRLALEGTAIQMWMEYVRLGLANPDLGETRIALAHLQVRSIDDLLSGDTLDSQRYLWFLTALLDASEHLILHRYTPLWKATIEENIRYHRDALAVFWPTEAKFYSETFGVLVDRVLAEQQDVPAQQPRKAGQDEVRRRRTRNRRPSTK